MKPTIRILSRDPKLTEFSTQEFIINIKEGSLFYKSNKGIHKLNPSETIVGGSIVNNFTTEEITNEYITNNSTTINNNSFFTLTGDDLYYSLGKIGIGTTISPTHTLDVGGDINLTGTLYQNGTAFGSSPWTTTGDDLYYNTGNVGIGITTTATEKLELNGNLLLNTGNIISTGDIDLLTDNTLPHAEDRGYVNISGTTATTTLNGDLNVISNHTLSSAEQIDYNGCLADNSECGFNGASSFMAVAGIGNATFDGDLQVNGAVTIGGASIPVNTNQSMNFLGGVPLGSLAVKGKIYSDFSDVYQVPDYVFEPDYPLKPLNEVEQYIKTYKHLPNIPSAEDKNGWHQLSLEDRDMKLLEKVEELTLYVIDQQKQINKLKEKLK